MTALNNNVLRDTVFSLARSKGPNCNLEYKMGNSPRGDGEAGDHDGHKNKVRSREQTLRGITREVEHLG